MTTLRLKFHLTFSYIDSSYDARISTLKGMHQKNLYAICLIGCAEYAKKFKPTLADLESLLLANYHFIQVGGVVSKSTFW